MNDKNINSQ